jgi:hypothetical protein
MLEKLYLSTESVSCGIPVTAVLALSAEGSGDDSLMIDERGLLLKQALSLLPSSLALNHSTLRHLWSASALFSSDSASTSLLNDEKTKSEFAPTGQSTTSPITAFVLQLQIHGHGKR